jgi:dihydrodipicolinate synthase/N-acetylneuraminate lyase
MGNTKNHTDIHENYGSIEEFEADITKLADAIENVHNVASSTKLPPVITEGMMYSGLASYSQMIDDAIKAEESEKAFNDLLAALRESDGEDGVIENA